MAVVTKLLCVVPLMVFARDAQLPKNRHTAPFFSGLSSN